MRRIPALARIGLAAVAASLLPLSCADVKELRVLEREQLFTLGYGVLEDQLNLFELAGEIGRASCRERV